MSLLVTLFARWGAPAWLARPLAWFITLAAILALLGVLRGCYDRAVEQRYEAKVSAQAEKAARVAAEAAASASAETRNEVEKSNADARKAAIGSDDPLRSGLDSLRNGAPAPRPAAR